MTTAAHVAEQLAVVPLDPASPRGIKAARDIGVITAAVITRIRREGRELPPVHSP